MSVSIRTRLLLLVMAVLLPAVAAAVWVVAQTWLTEQKALERHMRDTTRALSMVIDQELAHRAVIARVLSLSRMLDSAPDVPTEQLQLFGMQARRAMQGLGGWVEMYSADRELLNTRLPAPDKPTPPAALRDEPFVGPLSGGEPGINGGLHAMVTHPVQRDGRTLLNIGVTILPQELQALLDRQQLPPDWIAAVIDRQGNIVTRHPGGVRHAGRKVSPDLRALLDRRAEATFETNDLDGRPVIAYYSTSPRGWTYVTAVPREALTGVRAKAVMPVALGALLLLGLGVGGVLLVSRRITGPIYSLKSTAAALQAGRPVPVQSTGIVECDEVADALGEAAAAIARSRDELQGKVDEAVARTREAEQRVSQSQRVEAMGRLTGGVAHDFNNLLGVISNSAHLIQRHADDDQMLNVPVAAILRSVDVGSRLTQHLLRFAGRQPVRPQSIALSPYFGEVQELLRTVLGKRIELAAQCEPGTAPIKVDSSELELALINMALNARDAIASGGHVWLRARNAGAEDTHDLPPSDYVLITFADDGRGIAEELAERVFEPFFTTKPVGKGTGLGLSQVHGFCVQAGGTARLASTPGLGTTVSLLLPAGGAPAATGDQPAPQAPRARMAGRHVLLVEDNDELGRVTAALLRSFGCHVEQARDPREALARFDEGAPIDVVLTDVVMPGDLDGIELARRLRQRRPALPIVLISGYSAALTGVHEFLVLQKPCAPAQLLDVLQRAIEGRAVGQAS